MYSSSSHHLISGARRMCKLKCIACSYCVHRRFAHVHCVNSLLSLPISTLSLPIRFLSSNSRKRRGLRRREIPPPPPLQQQQQHLNINNFCDANPLNARIKEDVTMKGATIATITATPTSEIPFPVQSTSELLPSQIHHSNKIINSDNDDNDDNDLCSKDRNKHEGTSEGNIERREKKIKKISKMANSNIASIINNHKPQHSNNDTENTRNSNNINFTQKKAVNGAVVATDITQQVLPTDHVSKQNLMRQIRKQNLLLKQHKARRLKDDNFISEKINGKSQSVTSEIRPSEIEQADSNSNLEYNKNNSTENQVSYEHDNNNAKDNNYHKESNANHDTLSYNFDTTHENINEQKFNELNPLAESSVQNMKSSSLVNNNNSSSDKLEKRAKRLAIRQSKRKEHHYNGEEKEPLQERQLSEEEETHHVHKQQYNDGNRDCNMIDTNNTTSTTSIKSLAEKTSQIPLHQIEHITESSEIVRNEESNVTVKRNKSARRRRSNVSRMQRREMNDTRSSNSHDNNKCAEIKLSSANESERFTSIPLETNTTEPVTQCAHSHFNSISHTINKEVDEKVDSSSEDRINAAVRAVLAQCTNKSLSTDSTSSNNNDSCNNDNTKLENTNTNNYNDDMEATSLPSHTTDTVGKLRKSASTRIQEHLLRKRLLLQHRERQKSAEAEPQEQKIHHHQEQQQQEEEKQVSHEQHHQCNDEELPEPQSQNNISLTHQQEEKEEKESIQNNHRNSFSKRLGKKKLRARAAKEMSHRVNSITNSNNTSNIVNNKHKEHEREPVVPSVRSTHTSLTANPLYYPDHREVVLDIFHQLAEINNALGERYKAQSYYTACESLKKNDNLMRLLPPNLIPLPAFVNELGDAATISDNLTKRHNLISSEGVLPGVGNKLRGKIVEILRTGDLKELHSLEAKPLIRALRELTKVHGFGPRTAIAFYRYYGISTVEELKKYAAEHDTGERGTVGNKSSKDNHVQKAFKLTDAQRVGLEYYDEITQRIPYAEGRLHEAFLKIKVRKYLGKEYTLTICGSYRRKVPSSGDIDVLITRNLQTKNSTVQHVQENDNKPTSSRSSNEVAPEEALATFVTCLTKEGYILASLAQGPTKFMGICRLRRSGGDNSKTTTASNNGSNSNNSTHTLFTARRIDIRFVDAASYPAAMLYFTGSKNFNVIMRSEALKKNYILNEYGLFRNPTQGNEGIASLHEMISRLAKAHYYWSTNTINPNILQSVKPMSNASETNDEENSINHNSTCEGADKRANGMNSNNNNDRNSDDKGDINKKKRGKEFTPKQLREMKELVCKVDSLRVKVYDEQDVFDALDMKYVPPQDRNM